MAIAKSATILILFFALATYANADGDISRVRPPVGQDLFGGKNHARDVLLPGEKIVNVLSFGAKGDGQTDCTEVKIIPNFYVILYKHYYSNVIYY
jgi:hypothetical protein